MLLIPRPVVWKASLSGCEVEIGGVKFDIIDIQINACNATKDAVRKVLKNDEDDILKKSIIPVLQASGVAVLKSWAVCNGTKDYYRRSSKNKQYRNNNNTTSCCCCY